MAVRQRPFREWVVVYHDPKKTNLKALEARLREKGCPKAKLDVVPAVKTGDVTIGIDNPFVTPGDCVLVEVRLPEGKAGRAIVVAPETVKARAGPERRVKGGQTATVVALQTTKKTPAGKHAVSVKVKIGDEVVTVPLTVEVVAKVG